jgi:small subunit ribosomal protein S8
MSNTNDPISDLLTRIRNGQMGAHKQVIIPGSKMKLAICKILEDRGYIENVQWFDEGPQGKISVQLRYDDEEVPMIHNLRRVSRPSRRVYVGVDEIPQVLNGLGVAILSTSRGVLSDRDARAANVGGEVLCEIY